MCKNFFRVSFIQMLFSFCYTSPQRASAIPERQFDACVDHVLGLGKHSDSDMFNTLGEEDAITTEAKKKWRAQKTTASERDVIGFLDNMVKSDGVEICPKNGKKYFVKESFRRIYYKYVY